MQQHGRQRGHVLRLDRGPNNNINTQYNGRVDYQMTSKDLLACNIYYVPVNNDQLHGPLAHEFLPPQRD